MKRQYAVLLFFTMVLLLFASCNYGKERAKIIAVAAGWKHTVGLREDGTVVAVGDNYYGACDVSDW